jgi:mycoredoxin
LTRFFPHTGVMADHTDIVLYTRPGCPFCTMLRADLRANNFTWTELDIWQDPDAAAAVRAAANGNETVPTANIGDAWLVNPSIEQVRKALAAAA